MGRRLQCLVVVGVLALGAPAIAHSFKVDSHVTMNYQGSRFKGEVHSSKGFCSKWRKVVLYKFSGGTYQKVGSDKTNREGTWSIYRPDSVGSFYAKATFKKFVNDDHAHRCTSAESDFEQINP